MEIGLTVLGSGSSGNAALLEVGPFGLLIDAGLGPRQIAARLKTHGRTWNNVRAVVLTHTHADHWQEATLKHLAGQRIPLYCDTGHAAHLERFSPSFRTLLAQDNVRRYEAGTIAPVEGAPILISAEILSHDSRPTLGLRFDCGADPNDPEWSMGWLSDLGTWGEREIGLVVDVDLLALEFNHDVAMQRASGRPQELIDRVLGDAGHLSNEQAAEFLSIVGRESSPGSLKNVVQLHLSRHCNRPDLARRAAERAVAGWERPPRIQTADQDDPLRVRVARFACSGIRQNSDST